MLELDPRTTATVAVATAAVAGLLLVVVLVLALRLRTLVREHRRALDPARREDVIGALGRHGEELAALRRDVGDLEVRATELRELARGAVSRVGLVRYDAFDDMGGALSFSAALLDEHGD